MDDHIDAMGGVDDDGSTETGGGVKPGLTKKAKSQARDGGGGDTGGGTKPGLATKAGAPKSEE